MQNDMRNILLNKDFENTFCTHYFLERLPKSTLGPLKYESDGS